MRCLREPLVVGNRRCRSVATRLDAVSTFFVRKGFDQTLSVDFTEETLDLIQGLQESSKETRARQALHYTLRLLEKAKYCGWYVVVVQNYKDSSHWRPRLMIDGRDRQMTRVKRVFRKAGRIDLEESGPIKDLRSCSMQMARRLAIESGPNAAVYDVAFMYRV